MLIAMKATIDIPDDLYRKLSARSTEQGRSVDAVAIDLLRRGLEEDVSVSTTSTLGGMEAWLALGRELSRNAPPGPTGTEILEADRNRLERH
jgi:plasmid stability protein